MRYCQRPAAITTIEATPLEHASSHAFPGGKKGRNLSIASPGLKRNMKISKKLMLLLLSGSSISPPLRPSSSWEPMQMATN